MSLAHDYREGAVAELAKPALISVEEAKRLNAQAVTELFVNHLNPGQLHFMKLLGFHKVIVERAEGVHYVDRDGRKILDFFGGFGSLALGHNHPRILEARVRFQNERRHEIGMAFLSQYAAALAKNLATIAPGKLDFVFLGSTGSEVMEAAIKVAEQAQGPKRSKIVYAENSFHGKTKGAPVADGFATLPLAVQPSAGSGEGPVWGHRGVGTSNRRRSRNRYHCARDRPGRCRHRRGTTIILEACA